MKRYIASICAALFLALTVQGQNQENNAYTVLEDLGFEDIRVIQVADTIYASLEDPTYRGTFRGAATAIKKLEETHPEVEHFNVVLTDYKMPQLIVRASKRGGIWNVSVDREMSQALGILKGAETKASSTGKIDITFFPKISFTNNHLNYLADFYVRLAPTVALTLWKGSRLTIQPIIPIWHTDHTPYNAKNFVQMGTTNLRQEFISTNRWQVSAAVGFFHVLKAGVQAKVKFHALRNLSVSLEGGLTGTASYTYNDEFVMEKWEQKHILAKIDFYEPWSKVQAELTAGRFIYGDKGARLDLTRHFGEYAIGVYGIHTAGENNAGFHFAIPLGGKKQHRKGVVRFRLPEYYNLEYSMVVWGKYADQNMGDYIDTRPDENRAAHFWQPAFVEEYIERTLNGSFE